METLKLNSDGKVVIPGLGSGKKRITIKQLSDKISHIPDTNSIEVDIDSKQGLLPPERVTIKSEKYPFEIGFHPTVKMLVSGEPSMIFWGIPYGCNGFIPDYIDTNQLYSGDSIYIIDPEHNDTSKYTLDENKTWKYIGNFNDPEIGGVEGTDYSNIKSTKFGGFWLIRRNENANDKPFIINNKGLYGSKRGYVLYSNDFDENDVLVSYDKSNGKLEVVTKSPNGWKDIEGSTFESLEISEENQQTIINSEHDFLDGYWLIKNDTITWYEGVLNKINADQVVNPPEEGETANSNIIVNPYCTPVKLNKLIFDGEINSMDRIWMMYYNPELNTMMAKDCPYKAGKGFSVSTQMYVADKLRTVTTYDVSILPGQAFWYTRRGTTPLTIRFPESV